MKKKLIIQRKQAVKEGLITYYTGKPCKHGHISERYTQGGICKECTVLRDREKREEVRRIRAEISSA